MENLNDKVNLYWKAKQSKIFSMVHDNLFYLIIGSYKFANSCEQVPKTGLKTPFRDGLLRHVAEDVLKLAKVNYAADATVIFLSLNFFFLFTFL